MISEAKPKLQICVNCGQHAAQTIHRTEIYGKGEQAVIIEDIPMIQCFNCGITYLEPQVIRMIDEICAAPQKHSSREYRQVAKIA